MQEISGIPIDILKKLGFSDADLEYILEEAEKYSQRWRVHRSLQHVPEGLRQEIIPLVTSSFQTGMALGIAKARNIPNVAKKFGFTP